MGTVITLDLRTELAPAEREQVFHVAERELHAADADFSTWRPDSWISRLRDDGHTSVGDCPLHVRQLLALAEQLEELTCGYFTSLWRADGHHDPTGLVKGWAAQRASDALALHGAPDHLVNAAGDIVLSRYPTSPAGAQIPWQVGISDPRQPGRLLGVVALPAAGSRWAVASSGRAERGDHILDPRTTLPATQVTAATVVVAESVEWPEPGAVADACATALVAAGTNASVLLRRLRGNSIRGLVCYADGQRYDPDQLLSG